MNITIFKNLFSTDVPFIIPLEKAISRIKNGTSKDLIAQIRKEKDKDKRNKIKSKLPAIVFGGEFSERSKKGLVKHSGLMVIDFDNFPDEESYKVMFNTIKNNTHIITAFRSPSGNGIKAVVLIPVSDEIKHERYFEEFEKEFDYGYFDKSNKDVCRVCFESYDADIYYNPAAVVYSPKLEDKGFSVHEKVVLTPVTDEDKIISKIMEWNWKYEFKEGERHNFTYVLSKAFCEYGVSQIGAENFIINHYAEDDFNENEIKTTVRSAYKSVQFGIKKFVDFDKKKKFDNDVKFKPKEEVKKNYNLTEDEYREYKKDITVDEFWIIDVNSKGEEKIKIDPFKFKIFLEQNGFKKTYLNDSQKPTFVKIKSNIVEETSIEKIKDFVLAHLMGMRKMGVWNYFASYTGIFSDAYLLMLDSIELMMLEDLSNKSFLAFQNGILEVTADKYKMIDYIDVDGYVWKSHIIPSDFKSEKMFENDYQKFIKNISHSSDEPLKSVIGYLICTYKNKMNNRAIIFNDETISDNPEGGTGKGLIIQGISKMRRTSILDGKTFDDKKSFPYQTVSKDTQVLVFDDVKKNWDFESKFSIITEGITLERKNKDAIKLPVEQSPKIVISTNYVIKGGGNSHDRRRFEIEIAQYYGANRTPFEDFGRELFDDWGEGEFNRFYNYMIHCLQLYLTNGLIAQEDAKNIEIRKVIAETNKEFYEWATENLRVNERIYRSDKYRDFVSAYPDYGSGRYQMSQKTFKIYIDNYAKYLGFECVDNQDNIGRYSEIINPDEDRKEVEEDNNMLPF